MSQLKCHIFVIGFIISFIYAGSASCTAKTSLWPRAAMVTDALVPPDISRKHNSSVTPGYYETSEYLIGSVAVGIVFLESNGTIDPSTEDWTSTEESNVLSEIQTALTWWANQNPSARVSFSYDIHYRVPTSYEPINRPHINESLWIGEAMAYLGYPGADYFTQVRDYINVLRTALKANWSFAIFVVDSSNDSDGRFADSTGSWFAYSNFGGPFLVMTFDNNDWGISNMDRITAHEVGHIFYATDEYDGIIEYSGYLNVSDVDGSGGIMDSESGWYLSSGTRGQVGWRDSDGDGIQDIVDTFPNTILSTYSPDPTNDSNLTYTGTVAEIPYPNHNPKGNGKNVTINTIVNVEYRVNSSDWLNASATDGSFDEAEENYTFTTSPLSSGTHLIEVRGINLVGNMETSFADDVVAVDTVPPKISITSPTSPHLTNLSSITAVWNGSDNLSGIGHYEVRFDEGSFTNVETLTMYIILGICDGTHRLTVKAVDNAGNFEESSVVFVVDTTSPLLVITSPKNGSVVRSSFLTVSWSGLDDVSSVARYKVRLDENTWIDLETNTTYSFAQVGDGDHTIYVEAVDKAGNYRQVRIHLVIDTSLIGEPGWIDDTIVFGAIGVVALIAVGFFFIKRRKK